LRIAEHDVGRHDAVRQNAALAIALVDEGVDRPYPLARAQRQLLPLAGGEDAGYDVERDDALGRILVAIDVEGDAHLAESGFGGLLTASQLGCRVLLQPIR
jgi:hypothetical protein